MKSECYTELALSFTALGKLVLYLIAHNSQRACPCTWEPQPLTTEKNEPILIVDSVPTPKVGGPSGLI